MEIPESDMTEETHPIVALTDAGLDQLLKRAFRITLALGLIAALILLIGAGWRNAAMLATGAAISAASILEGQRLLRLINSKLDKQRTPRSGFVVAVFFVLRLTVFAGVIYGSLKCFHGSIVALLCGLGLAILATVWEAFRLLRD